MEGTSSFQNEIKGFSDKFGKLREFKLVQSEFNVEQLLQKGSFHGMDEFKKEKRIIENENETLKQ